RMIVGAAIMFWLGWVLIKSDMLPDLASIREKAVGARRSRFDKMLTGYDEVANHERIYRLSAIFVVVYALVMTIIAFDGIMALQPHWFSNLFGGWFFMGAFLGGHTLLALMMMYGVKA